jgi:hypothetical protein
VLNSNTGELGVVSGFYKGQGKFEHGCLPWVLRRMTLQAAIVGLSSAISSLKAWHDDRLREAGET